MIKNVYLYTSPSGTNYFGETRAELVNKVFDYKIENGRLFYRKSYYPMLIYKEYKECTISISVEIYTEEEIRKEFQNCLFDILAKE